MTFKSIPIKRVFGKRCKSLFSIMSDGSSIWIAYKDYCGGDIKTFEKAIKKKDKKMLAIIKKELG